MNMNNNAWERFHCATMSLAADGSIKDRLTEAYVRHLSALDEEEIPRELREEFRALSTQLRRERPLHKREDPVRATVRKMSNGEAAACAHAVVRLFAAMSKPAVVPRGVPATTAPVMQLFAAEA
jgi:hypothetical protein